MHIGIKIMTLEKEPSTYSEARPPQGIDTSVLDTEINKNPNKKRNAIIAGLAGGALVTAIAIGSVVGSGGEKNVDNPTVPEAPTEPGTSEVEPANNLTSEQYQEIYENVPNLLTNYPEAGEVIAQLPQGDADFIYEKSKTNGELVYSIVEQYVLEYRAN